MNILSLQNISYDRGTDRIIDLAKMRRNDRFIICGVPRDDFGWHLMASKVWEPNMELVGLVTPKEVLKMADVLIRLTRRNDPWGRDIIEALAFGKPVIATGTWDGFVKHYQNGFLVTPYSTALVSHYLDKIKELPRVKCELFSPMNADLIRGIYESIIRPKPVNAGWF